MSTEEMRLACLQIAERTSPVSETLSVADRYWKFVRDGSLLGNLRLQETQSTSSRTGVASI